MTIAILSVVMSIGMIAYQKGIEKARVEKAKADLAQLKTAISQLEEDTNRSPGVNPGPPPTPLRITPCVQNPEVYLDTCDAGLRCTNGLLSNWNGPYMNPVPKDPWGTSYFFDPDYKCFKFVEGCQQIPDLNNTGVWVRAIVSFGPNKLETYNDGDNVVLVLCQDIQ